MPLNYIKYGILQKSDTFNLRNLIQMIEDLGQINSTPDIKLCLFDIGALDTNSNVHVQSIIGKGFIIIPPHEFEHPSHWSYRQ
jgi:hypothetical protein